MGGRGGGGTLLLMWGEAKETEGLAFPTPSGDNLEHNTHVSAQPNFNADGAFGLPPFLGLVDGCESRRALRNGTKVQFATHLP